jgi:hypothetical protein
MILELMKSDYVSFHHKKENVNDEEKQKSIFDFEYFLDVKCYYGKVKDTKSKKVVIVSNKSKKGFGFKCKPKEITT